ncbi:leucine-rich repeat extensin-like protein 1 [Helianthus annuus]|uniref:leucine-rich repeat extensin-like protein 1 n=1 Tax=Helianthus annuus TaxID=4232 RepID=UPI001652FD77|nr:leucine-rich repeat extensin-like protein 1 [Helianthus annuus]
MAGQTLTNNNLALGAGSGTTPLSSPAVTRSLDPEFEAEGPPPGFDNITTISSQAVVTNPFLYMPSQTPPGRTEGTGGSAFAPGTAVFSQTSRLYSTPVITSASPSILVSETNTPQYYQPLVSNPMPPLYSAALTAALSTPPHQSVIMPTGVMNAPVTPGNQMYFPGYLPSYGGTAYPLQGTAQGSSQSPYAAYMPPWWNFPTPQPMYTQAPTEPVHNRENAVRPRITPLENSGLGTGPAPGVNIPPTQTVNVEEDELTKPCKPVDATFRSKFTRRIAEAPIKEKPKMPQTVGKYDGLTDPDDHLNLFKSAGEVACWPMPL